MDEPRLGVLRAVLDRMIPPDEFPAACAAGVDEFVLRILTTDLAAKRSAIEAGLDAVEHEAQARAQTPFLKLPPEKQDEVLHAIENGDVKSVWTVDAAAWFAALVALAMEGYYADPGNGGNKGEVSWKMVGYDPGAARHV